MRSGEEAQHVRHSKGALSDVVVRIHGIESLGRGAISARTRIVGSV